jgi:LmbE family N-acetylglucosaminyl deacetylase
MVVAAHPDDEIIGVGGTIRKHTQNGDTVFVLVVSEGKSSRCSTYEEFDLQVLDDYLPETEAARKTLGVNEYKLLTLPDNRLDHLDLLDIIKAIQVELDAFAPEIVYTHFYGDLNIDHQLVSRAVITAARSLPGVPTREILLFETLSSTEQSLALGNAFVPNLFVDISAQLPQKLLAMQCYASELNPAPHPRSLENIEKNAQVWGAKCGVFAAEAFVAARILR